MEDPHVIVKISLALIEEWWTSKPDPRQSHVRASEHWLPPSPGWVKANVDGAFSSASRNGGSGIVLRDHHGGFRAAACRFLTDVPDPERAELLACKHALDLAAEQGVDKVWVETDCLSAVTKIKGVDKDRSGHGPLVEAIKDQLKGFSDYSVNHVRRSGNGLAHSLAKEGCENKCNRSWVEVPPYFIVDLLASECAVN
jgi:ribonuclease HI